MEIPAFAGMTQALKQGGLLSVLTILDNFRKQPLWFNEM